MSLHAFLTMLALLLFAHALADYPLQGDFLSRAKNRTHPIPGVPWYQAMAAHAFTHAGFVLIITGSLVLAALEFCCHALIDDAKCAQRIGFNADQILHVTCKLSWCMALVIFGPLP